MAAFETRFQLWNYSCCWDSLQLYIPMFTPRPITQATLVLISYGYAKVQFFSLRWASLVGPVAKFNQALKFGQYQNKYI
jgi:hypothetical protein